MSIGPTTLKPALETYLFSVRGLVFRASPVWVFIHRPKLKISLLSPFHNILQANRMQLAKKDSLVSSQSSPKNFFKKPLARFTRGQSTLMPQLDLLTFPGSQSPNGSSSRRNIFNLYKTMSNNFSVLYFPCSRPPQRTRSPLGVQLGHPSHSQDRAFSIAGPPTWNSLPISNRNSSSLEQFNMFKGLLKTDLF